ncbi:MAG: hypothetical protein RIS85_2072 [Pseudomonadota bacterium]
MIAKEEAFMVRWADADVRALPDCCNPATGADIAHPLDSAVPPAKRRTGKRLHAEMFIIAAMVTAAFANAGWMLLSAR